MSLYMSRQGRSYFHIILYETKSRSKKGTKTMENDSNGQSLTNNKSTKKSVKEETKIYMWMIISTFCYRIMQDEL